MKRLSLPAIVPRDKLLYYFRSVQPVGDFPI